ncbi:AGAP007641-PA-like protein [Anopheles sinensis]|uniref:AGAP007641-PA-like protein n=1 Tax=Anopheles sinensis TaxID=74873 RepID=A0A084VFB1_ANOSI|nr:AGAP007641-PA-like protein [Anopheles sinensis]
MATSDSSQLSRVDVVFLAYKASTGNNSTVTLDSVSTVSLYELERHLRMKRAERASMSAEAYNHYRWYNAALVTELRTSGKGKPRPLLRVFHWYIETSNVDAFRMEGQQCEAVSLVVAAEVEHWYGARPGGRSSSGSRARVLSFGELADTEISRNCQPPTATTAIKRQRMVYRQSVPHRNTTSTPRQTLERIREEV